MNKYRIVETKNGSFRIQQRIFWLFWYFIEFRLHTNLYTSIESAKSQLDELVKYENGSKVKKVVWP